MYVVLEGRVAIIDDYGGAQERVLVEYGPGGFVGEYNVLTGQASYMSAVAAERTRLVEAAADFPGGLAFGGAPGDVGAGAGAAAHPGQRDGVDGAVEGPVCAAVEPVPDGAAAAGREGAGAAEGGERGLAAAPARMGEADDGLRGADRPDAVAAGEAGGRCPRRWPAAARGCL
jgi:hypothetical protein